MYVVVIVVGTRCWHRHWLFIAAVICSRLQQYLSGKISIGHLPEFAGHWGCLLVGDRCSFAGTVGCWLVCTSCWQTTVCLSGVYLSAFAVGICARLFTVGLSAIRGDVSKPKKEPTNVE